MIRDSDVARLPLAERRVIEAAVIRVTTDKLTYGMQADLEDAVSDYLELVRPNSHPTTKEQP